MKRIFKISFIVVLIAFSLNLMAQKAKKTSRGKENAGLLSPAKSSPRMVWAYLGHSEYKGGEIPKHTFDSLLRQGLIARDSMGNSYKVDGFTFSYGARNLYEDSVGNLMVLTDFFSEPCLGDTVSAGISLNIYQYGLTKPGDTAYFDNIKVAKPDGGQWGTAPMRFVLTK